MFLGFNRAGPRKTKERENTRRCPRSNFIAASLSKPSACFAGFIQRFLCGSAKRPCRPSKRLCVCPERHCETETRSCSGPMFRPDVPARQLAFPPPCTLPPRKPTTRRRYTPSPPRKCANSARHCSSPLFARPVKLPRPSATRASPSVSAVRVSTWRLEQIRLNGSALRGKQRASFLLFVCPFVLTATVSKFPPTK